jgi:phage portal protein BeeE
MYVRVAREKGVKLFYLRDPENGIEDPRPYTDRDFIHVWDFSIDGLTGLSPIAQLGEQFGELARIVVCRQHGTASCEPASNGPVW